MTEDTKIKKACGRSECGTSTHIDDETLTFGLGKLDEYGFWAKPCYACARAFERSSPGKKAWPRSTHDEATLLDLRIEILVAEKVMGWKLYSPGEYQVWLALHKEGEFTVYLDNEERLTVSDKIDIHGEDFDEEIEYIREWHPTKDPAAALEVLERLRELRFYAVLSTPLPGQKLWEMRGWRPETNDGRFIAHGPSMAKAVCMAALDAVGVKTKEGA